jgi:hypothetical protein
MSDPVDKKHDGPVHTGPDHSAPYPLSRLAPSFGLVDMAREIEEADTMLSAVAGGRLETLAAQIRALQEEAHRVLEQAKRDAILHRAECRFKKVPGAVYHLYKRQNDTHYFSLLSPDDWGPRCPHSFEGSYRLEVDMSWTPASESAPATTAMVKALLSGR